MIWRLLHSFYRRLHKTYPEYQGCGPCPHRPPPRAKRRAVCAGLPFPVDLVYTWVDGKDKKHAAKRAACMPEGAPSLPHAQGMALFTDNEELRFSLRSVHEYAPWARKIIILTDEQTPDWLNTEHEKIVVVDHKDCVPEECLPTFNSHAIEPYLHRIPGLAEHFIYMNDDFFLSAPTRPEDFFTPNGLPYLFIDWRYSRRFGYAKMDTPHACSYYNTRDFMKKKGICFKEEVIAGHIPYPCTKENAKGAEDFFAEAINIFSRNKFRTNHDMAFYSHCLPHWSYAFGRAVPFDLPFYYINTARFDRHTYYACLLREKGDEAMPLFFCLNDVGEMKPEDNRHDDMRDFLEAFFPSPSPYEKQNAAAESDTQP